MKWLMIIRLIIVFAPMIQKLFSDAGKEEKDQALKAGINKANVFFPKFRKVSEKLQPGDCAAIVNLFEWFAAIKEDPEGSGSDEDTFHKNER